MGKKPLGAKPIAGYARLSVSKDTSVSIASQQQMLERWAQAHGHEITIYTDDGFSGSKDIERPAFERMLAALEAGQHDAVLVKSVDRLGRRLKGFIELADRVRIITVEGGIDTGTPTGRMMLSLLSTFAEFEAAQIGQRQAASQAYRRQHGLPVGLPPFGYTTLTIDGQSVTAIDESTAKYVVEVFQRTLKGDALRPTCEWLNDQGVLTRQGNLWTTASLAQLLDNPRYAGYRVSGGDYVRDASGLPIIDDHLALVTLTEWQQAKDIRKARGSFADRGQRHDRLLLSGIAFCGVCGSPLHRSGSTQNGKIYHSYRCGADNKSVCPERPIISAARLDAYVTEQLQPLMSMPVTERMIEVDQETSRVRTLLQAELDAIGESLGKASADEMQGLFDRMQDLRLQLDSVTVEMVETERETGETFADIWPDDPRTVIDYAIERVVLHKAGRAPVQERVEIIWHEGQDWD